MIVILYARSQARIPILFGLGRPEGDIFHPLAIAGGAAANNLVDETAICGKIFQSARAAQQERRFEGDLEMAIRALDRSILVGDPSIVARRR